MASRTKKIMATITSLVGILFLASSVGFANPGTVIHVSGSTSQVDLDGTDSAGSYSHGASKSEESTGKSVATASSQESTVKKSEGSDSKGYSHKKHAYSHKKEGSGSKGYSHKKHAYSHKKEGSGSKGYSHKKHAYSHKKEGSGSKGYSHGSPHGKSRSHYKASGHGRVHGKDKSPFEHVLCFTKKLGLTDEQVKEIKAHEFEFKKVKIQTKADHAIAHMELDRLVHSETVDEAGIRALADRISEIKSRKIHAVIEAKIALLKILTPEQRQRVSKMHSSH